MFLSNFTVVLFYGQNLYTVCHFNNVTLLCSLVRALTLENFRINYDYNEMITDGIDISKWNVTVQGEREPLQYSVWDFAGQTVYYNTHQVKRNHCYPTSLWLLQSACLNPCSRFPL